MRNKENYNYYNEFLQMTDYIIKSVNIFKDFMANFKKEELESVINDVHSLENSSDVRVHKMKNHLIKDFLPPVDREDIVLICNKLDDIEDGIDEALINIKILDIEKINIEVLEQIDILVQCCDAVKELFLDLKNFKDTDLINKKSSQVNNLEEIGDRIYEKLMSSLYLTQKNPIELIKWTTIYNCIEETIDSCEEIADCIEEVAMKNS